jgi:pyruvate,water dikinase
VDAVTSSPILLAGQAARNRALCGGKAAVLAELADAFPVPPFFVLTPGAFGESGLGGEAMQALQAALSDLGPGPFAVRSSGLEEDGDAAAHAGQFETRLSVRPVEVAAAAEAVWRSGFAPDLAAYRRARGLDDAPQPPAVIVQRMLNPEAAGVAFTADPVTGDRDTTVINAVAGLADRLVSGEMNGQTYRVHRDGRVLEQPASEAVLGLGHAQAVADLARRAEARFGAPQDVEWAVENGRVHLLQSRPITTLGPPGSTIPLQPDLVSDLALGVWDNSNIVESYPGVVSPLTFSFAREVYGHVYRAFAALLGVTPAVIAAERPAFDTLLGRVHGRVYYNLLAWYRLLSLLPGFTANRAFMESMMGVAEALPPELARSLAPPAPTARARWADRLRVARVGAGLLWRAAVLPRDIRRFSGRLNGALTRSDAEIEALPLGALAREYRELEARLLERWDAPLVNDLLCMIAFGASRKLLGRWAGAEGLALHSEVMIGQGDIVSAEPARRIREMGARLRDRSDSSTDLIPAAMSADPILAAAYDAYLAKFGDRCTEELKLESATLHDDPSPLLAAIGAASRSTPTAHQVRADSDLTLRALFRGRPVKRAVASRLLRWAKARVRDRENLRFERTRLFGRVRRIVRAGGGRLAAAGLLAHRDDVFLLTIQEWLGAIEGGLVTRDLRGLVDLRRAEDAGDRARPDPPERFQVRGAFLPGLASLESRDSALVDAGERRSGVACCAGVVTARVRVVDDPRRQALEPGEILVARHTDPGWIAVFANAAGVIAERGSLLSHSAIVAREMGVPCVVALKDATAWLRTGDLVRLDGGAGTVERLPAGIA